MMLGTIKIYKNCYKIHYFQGQPEIIPEDAKYSKYHFYYVLFGKSFVFL